MSNCWAVDTWKTDLWKVIDVLQTNWCCSPLLWPLDWPRPQLPWLAVAALVGAHPCCNQTDSQGISSYTCRQQQSVVAAAGNTRNQLHLFVTHIWLKLGASCHVCRQSEPTSTAATARVSCGSCIKKNKQLQLQTAWVIRHYKCRKLQMQLL